MVGDPKENQFYRADEFYPKGDNSNYNPMPAMPAYTPPTLPTVGDNSYQNNFQAQSYQAADDIKIEYNGHVYDLAGTGSGGNALSGGSSYSG